MKLTGVAQDRDIYLHFKYLQHLKIAETVDITRPGVSHNMELTVAGIASTMV
jgi:predicted XRE-type DNA-binding protein